MGPMQLRQAGAAGAKGGPLDRRAAMSTPTAGVGSPSEAVKEQLQPSSQRPSCSNVPWRPMLSVAVAEGELWGRMSLAVRGAPAPRSLKRVAEVQTSSVPAPTGSETDWLFLRIFVDRRG